MICRSGTRNILVDEAGNPLDVGREQRLFTAKQKIALAYRDGGCMDPDCDRPVSCSSTTNTGEYDASTTFTGWTHHQRTHANRSGYAAKPHGHTNKPANRGRACLVFAAQYC